MQLTKLAMLSLHENGPCKNPLTVTKAANVANYSKTLQGKPCENASWEAANEEPAMPTPPWQTL